jgi:catechol 2,3-dioxygenase-like lactoylglutathione lyase family enzyme
MKKAIQSSRDVIIQVDDWTKAVEFYETTLGFHIVHRSPAIVGFETGAFCLYVEKGNRPGPVFDFLVSDAQDTKDRLLAAIRWWDNCLRCGRKPETGQRDHKYRSCLS